MNTTRPAYPGAPAVKVTCVVPHERGPRLRALIRELGIDEMTIQHARRTLLHDRRIRLGDAVPLSDELVEVVRFRVHVVCEEQVIASLVAGHGFGEPGRGNIVSRRVHLLGLDLPPCEELPQPTPTQQALQRRELAGLCCIVPRGEGTSIARLVLNAGLGAPFVTYAQGVASRAKLGLIRVTIPAGKEIVTTFVDCHDVGDAFRMVNEVLRINRPGAGFCYWYSLHAGMLDTRIWVGRQPHVASMEQVITALDMLTGGTTWRRKMEATTSQVTATANRLTGYTIHGPEVETEPVVNAALAAGAGGATLYRVHRELLKGADDLPSALESSELIIPESMLPRIHEAVSSTGLVERRGFIEVADVGGASGYSLRDQLG